MVHYLKPQHFQIGKIQAADCFGQMREGVNVRVTVLRRIRQRTGAEAPREVARLQGVLERLDALARQGLPDHDKQVRLMEGCNPDTAWTQPGFAELKARVERADVLLLGTPDYHGSVSSTLKNFLDHFWKEFSGKLFATVVASHEKGLTVHDQLRAIARQCNAWTLPYGVSLAEKEDVRDGAVASDALRQRLAMLTRDVRVYGELLATQRRHDLAGIEPGFLARLRK